MSSDDRATIGNSSRRQEEAPAAATVDWEASFKDVIVRAERNELKCVMEQVRDAVVDLHGELHHQTYQMVSSRKRNSRKPSSASSIDCKVLTENQSDDEPQK